VLRCCRWRPRSYESGIHGLLAGEGGGGGSMGLLKSWLLVWGSGLGVEAMTGEMVY